MTKIDIFSGFLGAGKTTLIKKLIQEVYAGQKIVLIENEFGEIGIDGGFLQEAGIQITEMNSGCICCSLVGDFGKALQKVMEEYHPDRILIEPSGVGKLSDVAQAVERAETDDMEIGCMVAVARTEVAGDGGMIQQSGHGNQVAALYCPMAYEKAPCQMIDPKDAEQMLAVLTAFLEEAAE